MSSYNIINNLDYDGIYDHIHYSNLPYDNNDKNFKPLTDPYHIQKWEEWLQYTADTIDVTIDELKSNNFKTCKDLISWCVTNNKYHIAYKKYYNEQLNKDIMKWSIIIKEDCMNKCEKHTTQYILQQFKIFLDELFNKSFIWHNWTRSIIEAPTYNSIEIFDPNPLQMFLYEYLSCSELSDGESEDSEFDLD